MTFLNDINYSHYRFVLKAGAAWNYEPLTFGFTFTAPSVGLFGKGSGVVDYFSFGVTQNNNGSIVDAEEVTNRFKDQTAEYKSPASLAGGMSYRYNNTTIHTSVEYFGAVSKYDVLPTQVFLSLPTGRKYIQSATLELKSVFNWGIGVEQHLNDEFKVYGSFITDNTAYKEGSRTTVAVSNWDLKHIMGGAAFSRFGFDITLGLGYSWGSERIPDLDFVQTEDGPVSAPDINLDATVKYRRLKLIIGLGFGSHGDAPQS